MGSQTNPLMRSLAAPYVEAKCLPEGKRIVSVTIDFSSLPYQDSLVSPLIQAYPELSIDAPNAYQVVEVNLSKLQNSVGLTEVRALIYYYREAYLAPYDFEAPVLTNPSSLLVTNVNTLQTVIVGTGSVPNELANGCVPFFGIGDTTVRFLNTTIFTTTPAPPAPPFNTCYGKGTFLFTNFDVPYYTFSGVWNPSD